MKTKNNIKIKNLMEELYSINHVLESCKKTIERYSNKKKCFIRGRVKFINKNVKKFGVICYLEDGDPLIDIQKGEFPVIEYGKNIITYHNQYNRDENTILCSLDGVISKYPTKVWACHCISIHSKDKNILDEKFLFYYLQAFQEDIYVLRNEYSNTISQTFPLKMMEFKIKLPPLNRQKEMAEYCEKLDASIEINKELIKNLQNQADKIEKKLEK